MTRIEKLAKPRETDTRFERLARLAVGRLAGDGRPVSRSTLTAMSAAVDDTPPGDKRGFCEATIDNNPKVRAVFDLARRLQAQGARRRPGAIPAQIRRLSSWDAARKLMLARDATAERQVGLNDLISRTGVPVPQALIDLRAKLDALPANRAVARSISGCAADHREVAKANRLRFASAVEALGRDGSKPTIAMIAQRARIHPSTVARLIREAAEIADAKKTGRPTVVPPNSLLRIGKREIQRALALERQFIRAIDHAVGTMAKSFVEMEIEAMRSARLVAEALDAVR